MSFTNYKDSMNDVVTTIAPVLDSFLLALRTELPNTSFVYDPELTYETSVAALRDDEFYNNDIDIQSPMFSFRRTLLKNVEDYNSGKRLQYQKITNRLDTYDSNPTIYAACMGIFSFEYIYYTKDILACEQFEISHAANRGVTGIRKLTTHLGDELGDLEYILNHQPLQDLTINSKSLYHKAIGGIVDVHGIYLMFESKGSIIKDITARVSNFIEAPKDGETLDTIQINS